MQRSYQYGYYQDYRSSYNRAGLRNLGNTCFMNSALQCIASIKILKKEIMETDISRIVESKGRNKQTDVLKTFRDYLENIISSDAVYSPKHLKFALGQIAHHFAGYEQQDAFDLMTTLITALSDSLNKAKACKLEEEREDYYKMEEQAKLEYSRSRHRLRHDSPIIDFFYSYQKNIITCCDCNYKKIRFQPFAFLSVPIPRDVCIYFVILNDSKEKIHLNLSTMKIMSPVIVYTYHIRQQFRQKHSLKQIREEDPSAFQDLPEIFADCVGVNAENVNPKHGDIFICYSNQNGKLKCQDDSNSRRVFYLQGVSSSKESTSSFSLNRPYEEKSNSQSKSSKNKHSSKNSAGIQKMRYDLNRPEVVDLKHCIDMFCSPSELAEGSDWECEEKDCKGKKCTFETLIYNLPPVMIIHLRRFALAPVNSYYNSYDSQFQQLQKVNDQVNFSVELDMTKYLKLAGNEKIECEMKYSLVAVSRHHGSLNGGHYNAYCYSKKKWFSCDDSHVSEIKKENVENDKSAIFLIYVNKKHPISLKRLKKTKEKTKVKTEIDHQNVEEKGEKEKRGNEQSGNVKSDADEVQNLSNQSKSTENNKSKDKKQNKNPDVVNKNGNETVENSVDKNPEAPVGENDVETIVNVTVESNPCGLTITKKENDREKDNQVKIGIEGDEIISDSELETKVEFMNSMVELLTIDEWKNQSHQKPEENPQTETLTTNILTTNHKGDHENVSANKKRPDDDKLAIVSEPMPKKMKTNENEATKRNQDDTKEDQQNVLAKESEEEPPKHAIEEETKKTVEDKKLKIENQTESNTVDQAEEVNQDQNTEKKENQEETTKNKADQINQTKERNQEETNAANQEEVNKVQEKTKNEQLQEGETKESEQNTTKKECQKKPKTKGNDNDKASGSSNHKNSQAKKNKSKKGKKK